MFRCLSNDSRVVRIPVHVQALYSKYKKLRQKLEYERGEEVTDEELAPMLGVRLLSRSRIINTCFRLVRRDERQPRSQLSLRTWAYPLLIGHDRFR